MRVTGAATLSQPPGTVWPALNDPAMLARAIPGCQRLDVTGPGACALTVVSGIAAVAGSYTGEARAVERRAPGLIRATVSGSGNRGQIGADVTLRLEPSGDADTELSYEGEIRAEGLLAAVGALVLASVARRLANQFLAALDNAVSALADVPAGVGEAGGADGPGGVDVPAGVAAAASAEADESAAVAAPATVGGPLIAALPAAARSGLLTGAAGALAGLVIGIVLGRRGRR